MTILCIVFLPPGNSTKFFWRCDYFVLRNALKKHLSNCEYFPNVLFVFVFHIFSSLRNWVCVRVATGGSGGWVSFLNSFSPFLICENLFFCLGCFFCCCSLSFCLVRIAEDHWFGSPLFSCACVWNTQKRMKYTLKLSLHTHTYKYLVRKRTYSIPCPDCIHLRLSSRHQY